MQTPSQTRPAVIKLGGALLKDPAVLDSFWPALKELSAEMPVVIVHGGGPQATAMARRLGHEPRIVEGRRVTSDLDLSIIHWTIRGQLNTQLTALALKQGLSAAGLSGIDGRTVQVEKRPPWLIGGESVDFGWVGDVKAVDPSILNSLLQAGHLPIVSPLGIDQEGYTYNVNADTVAQSIAAALEARAFFLLTESGGVRSNPDDPSSLLSVIDQATYQRGIDDDWIKGGMLVKLNVAFNARTSGIDKVIITSPDDILTRSKGTRVL